MQPKQQRVVYEFAVAGDGAGELQRELEQQPEWKEVQLVAPGCVRAEYTGEDGEPLALQLRALSAAHLLTRVERCKETLEETVINMMNDHEK